MKPVPTQKPFVYFVMGVSGSGKSTVGEGLAARLGLPFHDGDDYHPESNVEKMAKGIALTDHDRVEWLGRLHNLSEGLLEQNGGVIACSALKASYREVLSHGIAERLFWIYLKGDYDTIKDRMEERRGHFMPGELLQSQFDTLEEPEHAIEIDIDLPPEEILSQIMETLDHPSAQFGLVGLGVMGKSLSLNLADKGFSLSLFNRRVEGTEEEVALHFIAEHPPLTGAQGFEDLALFVASLEQPRKIFLMIPAGKALDGIITQLRPLLAEGDILIDGGNSHYSDTARRQQELEGIAWLGVGVSGGEEGALKGPSIMPGGNRKAYDQVKEFLLAIAAKDKNGSPCCTYVGHGGAGHFVKMVHNGIEYAEMQLLAEVYDLMHRGFQWNPDQIASLLKDWHEEGLGSFLLEITIEILQRKEGDHFLLDKILDKAGNKGTGSWTVQSAAGEGVPVPNLAAALFARYQSSFKEEREKAQQLFDIRSGFPTGFEPNLEAIKQGYHLSRLVNHHQGFHLIQTASDTHGWEVQLEEIARIWTNGCIIRSELMEQLSESKFPSGRILLQDSFLEVVKKNTIHLEQTLRTGLDCGVTLPCFTASWNYLLAYFSAQSPANLIQAQRDFFGAHTYQRVDDPSGKAYHTNW